MSNTVDPRSRGEDRRAAISRARRAGRSPLTRGRPLPKRVVDLRPRSIPAHAGKTSSRSRSCTSGRVDPRSRGEDQIKSATGNRGTGRSPLTRGRRCRRPKGLLPCGSIPAHAGKTCRSPGAGPWRRVDPRSRGEDLGRCQAVLARLGRSPLTRGRRHHAPPALAAGGSIPAHAGKTPPWTCAGAGRGVDPRSRGEDNLGETLTRIGGGRSPLTRGRPAATTPDRTRSGSIPAHAGKTGATVAIVGFGRVDPRSRGEDGAVEIHVQKVKGRSPLTRGRRQRPGITTRQPGSIPAHAGKTHGRLHALCCVQVDPRSRGEDSMSRDARDHDKGRSPLTRGRPYEARHRAGFVGSIPAHAGKTPSRR